MEKAKNELLIFVKNNAWGIIIAIAVFFSNYIVLSSKTEEQGRLLAEHEARIRAMELKQEMIMEKLKNIEKNTNYFREWLRIFEE